MRKNLIAIMSGLAFLPAVGHAAAPTLGEVLDASGITATGHATGSYSYIHSESGGSSSSSNSFGFDQAELTVSKLPTSGFGALVDVFAGQDVTGSYNYSAGFNTFGGGGEVNLHQAYVQYATGGLTVIGGKFATLAGSEVASDVLNSNATRSILFTQQPFTLTGVRAGYKFNDMVTAYVGANNNSGGATVDSDNQKTTELGLALAPITGLTINLTDYIGTESNSKINLADLVVGYTVGGLSLGLNADYNTSKNNPNSGASLIGVTPGDKTEFSGVALYANYQITPAFRAGLRGELTQSKDKTADTKGKAKEITLTGDYSLAKNFDLLGDVRYQKGDAADYTSGSDGDKGIAAVVKAIYKF